MDRTKLAGGVMDKDRREQELQELLDGELFVVASIKGVNHRPHMYTIGTPHVVYVADHHCGILNEYAIEEAERLKKAHCMHGNCNLPYRKHTFDRVAFLKLTRHMGEREAAEELLKCVEWCKEMKIDGFCFIDNGLRIMPEPEVSGG